MRIRPATLRLTTVSLSCGMALAVLAGCGSDDADDAGETSAASTSEAAEATAPSDPAAAEAEISENWAKLFASGDPTALEDGEELTEAIGMLAALAPPPEVKEATVTDVAFNSADEAAVTYDLLIDGEPVLPGATGTAVLVDGTWKVSKTTFCTLTTLASADGAAPGCE